VPGDGFRRTYGQAIRVRAEKTLDGLGFDDVIGVGGSSMGIDIIHLFRVDLRLSHRLLDRQDRGRPLPALIQVDRDGLAGEGIRSGPQNAGMQILPG